jgi:hypothetical protein
VRDDSGMRCTSFAAEATEPDDVAVDPSDQAVGVVQLE